MTDCKSVQEVYGKSMEIYAMHEWENFMDQDN